MPEPVLARDPKIAEPIHKISRTTAAFADAVDEGIEVAKRTGKHCSDAAEELMDDTTQRIKRHPVESLVTMFALGFIVGGFFDWVMRRK